MEKIDHENLDEPTHFLKIKSKLATYFFMEILAAMYPFVYTYVCI